MPTMLEICELFNGCDCEDYDIRHLAKNNLPTDCHHDYGETRHVIWADGWDFVLKIPRYGYTSCDYCEIEMEHYESAKVFGVEQICLPIELVYTTDTGIKIYKQPRYTFDTRAGRENGHKEYLIRRNIPVRTPNRMLNKIKSATYDGHRIDDYWMARVLQLYGKKFCRSFEKWVSANYINDLHAHNTGWLDKKPILLDYAGYHE